jgi:uncharacterized protein (DUF2267 family)
MQYDEFVQRVQERTNLDTRADVENLIEVTLVALAEPLSRDETNLLASQLPGEMKRILTQNREEPIPAKMTMRSFNAEEFHNRVKARLNVTYQQGKQLSHAVTSVITEAVTEPVIDNILEDLPEGYAPLFR